MIRMEGGDRMRVTLLDRMSTVENGGRSSMTLEDVLMAEMNSSSSRPSQQQQQQPSLSLSSSSPARNHRILLDVIRRDRRRDKTTWRSLRDKLRLKRSSTPSSDSDRHRLGFLLSISESGGNGGGAEREVREESVVQQPRMSLMELLEDADEGQMYDVVTTEEAVVAAERRGEETVTTTVEMGGCCCVCMMRSKGAAFIPCGHTFCRLCSRQLWVQRGNCPLCNTSILQVLDLF